MDVGVYAPFNIVRYCVSEPSINIPVNKLVTCIVCVIVRFALRGKSGRALCHSSQDQPKNELHSMQSPQPTNYFFVLSRVVAHGSPLSCLYN